MELKHLMDSLDKDVGSTILTYSYFLCFGVLIIAYFEDFYYSQWENSQCRVNGFTAPVSVITLYFQCNYISADISKCQLCYKEKYPNYNVPTQEQATECKVKHIDYSCDYYVATMSDTQYITCICDQWKSISI